MSNHNFIKNVIINICLGVFDGDERAQKFMSVGRLFSPILNEMSVGRPEIRERDTHFDGLSFRRIERVLFSIRLIRR